MCDVPSLPPALHHRDFRRLWTSMLCSSVAMQMAAVAIGWQVYSIHHSAFDLGLIGLAEFAARAAARAARGAAGRPPAPAARSSSSGASPTRPSSALLLVVTIRGAHQLWPFLALALVTGTVAAFGNPAGRSLVPELVPARAPDRRARAAVGRRPDLDDRGPGGRRPALRDPARRRSTRSASSCSSPRRCCSCAMTRPEAVARVGPEPPRLESLLGGIRLIRATPIILGAITLDLFAVLFGGAVALLPLFAKSILHTGPLGLGVLRSAIAVGALDRRHSPGAQAARRQRGPHAAPRRRHVRREHGRLRPLALVPRLGARARRQRLRRHDLDEHPLDHRRARDAELRCAAASTPSRACSSARRTSSARSSRARRRRCSARCRRWCSAAR